MGLVAFKSYKLIKQKNDKLNYAYNSIDYLKLEIEKTHLESGYIRNIYDEKYIKHLPQYNNNIEKLPCLIYDKSSCPIDRCQLSDINNENTICHPKYTQNVNILKGA